MGKEIVVRFDAPAYEEYKELQEAVAQGKHSPAKPTYEQLLASINNAICNLKLNPYYGDLVPRKYLNKAIVNRYGTDKLLRVELVGFWRMLYTIIGDEAKIIAFILEYMDHKEYNKKFGYKRR